MFCYQRCQDCPERTRETDKENSCDAGDFEYYLVTRSVEFAATRLGYNWPVSRSNGTVLIE